jgi:hypothetical protein
MSGFTETFVRKLKGMLSMPLSSRKSYAILSNPMIKLCSKTFQSYFTVSLHRDSGSRIEIPY